MKLTKGLLLMGLLTFLSGCAGGQSLDHYKEMTPTLSLEDYFTGTVKGWGVIQDFSGKVTRRFDVKIVGTWEDGVGTLDEDFIFYDGEIQKRIWTVKKLDDGSYEGTAGDIIGIATGETAGNAIRWKYQMDVPVNGQKIRLTFDDWMYLMNDDVLINRSYLKKFGLTVGELTLFMQKQD